MNRKQWEAHFIKQRESNLNVLEYCAQHHLKYKNFINAQYRYKSKTTKSFISVVTEHSQTQLSNNNITTVQLCCGQAKATLENCTPQWFAQFVKEVM